MSNTTSNQTDVAVFQSKLKNYKAIIDADIADYTKQLQKSTLQRYGAYARLETDAFLDILARGGKRIRGSLVMLGYEMSGGTDKAMIIKAARALEMIHAYILMIDDFQDRSPTRRGGPSAHYALADYHRKHALAGDSDHFGASIMANAALVGCHAAEVILANLDVDAELRIKVLSIVNQTMVITGHGQTVDFMNEVVAEVQEADVQRVLEWKTAHYTFLNPLHVGMVLAGADCHATDAITEYAMNAGKAFQITDDILGTFDSEQASGKSPMDDIREGKRTVLTLYALQHTNSGDKNFLIQMLGNDRLTPAEFERCKTILLDSGAVTYAQDMAAAHIKKAIASINRTDETWSEEGRQFLRGLAHFLQDRKA